MEMNSDMLNNIAEIKNEIDELNDAIDKKCIDIYNQNDESEKKIILYKSYLENVILEYHKICRLMLVKTTNT
jgi:hypothetical protein